MFKNVLVVEDLDSVGYGISAMLRQELNVENLRLMQYCNEAYLSFKSEEQNGQPYDLLITDLSFKQDHRASKINSGQVLIEKIREQNSELPIIICTVEEKPNTAMRFLRQNHISAYVLKGRDGLKDLMQAVKAVHRGEQFLSQQIERLLKGESTFEIEEYDLSLLLHLSHGLSQSQIATLFSSKGVSPSSLSTIEKRLNKLKDVLRANNNVQLVANAKDLGLI